jgi:hypothetical protein
MLRQRTPFMILVFTNMRVKTRKPNGRKGGKKWEPY